MKLFSRIAFAFAAVVAFALLASCDNAESRDVQNAYDTYMAALSARDGQQAVVLVDSNTISYYGDIKQACLHEGPAEIARRPFIDRLAIGAIRATIDLNYVKQLTIEQLFSHAVSKGLVGDDQQRKMMSIAAIQIDGDSAKATMSVNGKSTPLVFEFNREDGVWKIDLTSVFPIINRGFAEVTRAQNMTEDALLFEAFSEMAGREITETIWNKPSLQ